MKIGGVIEFLGVILSEKNEYNINFMANPGK